MNLEAILRENGRRRNLRMRPIELPQKFELELYRIFRQVPDYWRNHLQESILPLYNRALGAIQTDAETEDIMTAIAALAEGADRLAISLDPSIRRWLVRLETWHSDKWTSRVKGGAGVDLRGLLEPLENRVEVVAFLEWASGLIRNVSEETRRRVEAAVIQNLTQRRPIQDVARELTKAVGIERKRALRIAADQTNKLSGKMDELRHREAGIDLYVWETAKDDRVRDSHRAKQGKVFSWKKAPLDTGHPRTEPNCRCTAAAYIELEDV